MGHYASEMIDDEALDKAIREIERKYAGMSQAEKDERAWKMWFDTFKAK